jgi:hypothetical protein
MMYEAAGMNNELYQVPLSQFTTARDALVARLKAAGNDSAAAEAKRARKPSVAAWAANQVVWQARDQWARLQAAAEALRKKHEKATSPEELRQAVREQREALQACEARAAELLEQFDHDAGTSVLQKVGRTLLALAYGAPGVTPGRLDHELQPPGFEVFTGLTLATPKARAASAPPAAPAPFPPAASPPASSSPRGGAAATRTKAQQKADDQERARRREALAAAKTRHAESRRALMKSRNRLAAEEKRRDTLEDELAAARRACDDARRQLEGAEAEDAAADAALHALDAEFAE